MMNWEQCLHKGYDATCCRDGLCTPNWGGCESPIEDVMLAALSAAAAGMGLVVSGDVTLNRRRFRNGALWDAEAEIEIPGGVAIARQVLVGKYRSDFVLHRCGSWIAIECDGRDYHDRTTEQVNRDKARDRSFLHAGLPTARFSGSEIWNRPTLCAVEALSLLRCQG